MTDVADQDDSLAVEKEALDGLPRTTVDRLVTDLRRLLASLVEGGELVLTGPTCRAASVSRTCAGVRAHRREA